MYLTFDDGPDREYTPRVLALLTRYEARATFFMIGDSADRHADLVTDVLEQGSTVGNHTMTHSIDPRIEGNDSSYLDEVVKASELLERITGRRPTAFRPPWGLDTWADGSARAPMSDEVNEMGMHLWLWDADGADWKNPQPRAAEIVEQIRLGVNVGARNCGTDRPVILLHDGVPPYASGRSQSEVIPALELLLQTCTEKGHTFESLPGS